jgi:glutamate synthase (NADPH/NADH) small chain
MPLDMSRIEVAGKRVAVIGGGDSAMDCLRAAIRYSANEAVGIYRRGPADMPCGEREYVNATEEGVRFVFCAAPLAVLGNAAGKVTGLRLIRTQLGVAEPGQPHPFSLQPGTEFDVAIDLIIPALGFDAGPAPATDDFKAMALNESGGVVVDENQMTSLPGVFAGGDLVRGPTPLLLSVRDARQGAAKIHSYLTEHQKVAPSEHQ